MLDGLRAPAILLAKRREHGNGSVATGIDSHKAHWVSGRFVAK